MKRIYIFTMMFICASLANAQPFAVGHTTVTYTDPSRSGRSIATEIYYPAATAGTSVPVMSGQFPVVIIGHGFVMTFDAYQNFWDALVPLGYIVAVPKTEGSFSPVHSDFGKDLAFLVGKLQSESAANPASIFYNHVNMKSAIMGHSMGGGCSFLAAEYNTAITTMVTFAAATTTPSSITSAQHVTVPSLVFSGENDCVAVPATNQVPMSDSLGSVCKTFISVKGAAHCEFANYNFNCAFGESTCSPTPTITRTQQQDAVNDFLVLWLDYYLMDNCNSWNVFNDSLSVSPRITHNQSCTISNPVITQVGPDLNSTAATTYQWYLDGNPIPGATSQNYTPVSSGNYQVYVTYFNSCPYPSNTINITLTGILNYKVVPEMNVYPNPATDMISVDCMNLDGDHIFIRIYDVIGKEAGMKVFSKSGTHQKLDVAVLQLQKGVYFIEVTSGNSKITKKFIKQ